MRVWVAALVFLLVGCQGTSQPVARVTTSGQVTSSPIAQSTPAPGVDPLAKLDFTCRLPVFESEQSGSSPAVYTGGFVRFPDATFFPDPVGVMHPDPSTGGFYTDAVNGPTLRTGERGGPPFYDKSQRRWVPAASFQSTPDGAFYAYATWDGSNPSQGKVHIVEVGRGTEKVFNVTVPANAMGFSVFDFNALGVYLVANAFEQNPSGVWLMDRTSGAVRRLVQVNLVAAVRNGYAWAARIDPRDPTPPVLRRSGTASDSLVRIDLTTGAQTIWFYRPGAQVQLGGFDSRGAPIIGVSDPSGASNRIESWLVADAKKPGTLIYAGELYLSSPQGDGDRIWFAGGTIGGIPGIYLYTPASGLHRVFNGDNPAQSFDPVGFCT